MSKTDNFYSECIFYGGLIFAFIVGLDEHKQELATLLGIFSTVVAFYVRKPHE